MVRYIYVNFYYIVMTQLFKLSRLLKLFIIISILTSSLGISYAKDVGTLQSNVEQINSFVSNITKDNNAISEISYDLDRQILLNYTKYLDEQIKIKENNLDKVNDILHYI